MSFFLVQLSSERMPWWLLSVINGVTMMGQKIQTNDIHTNTINKHKATMSLKSDFSYSLIYKQGRGVQRVRQEEEENKQTAEESASSLYSTAPSPSLFPPLYFLAFIPTAPQGSGCCNSRCDRKVIHDSPLITSQSSRDDITSVRRDVLNEKNKNQFTHNTQRGKSGVTQVQ